MFDIKKEIREIEERIDREEKRNNLMIFLCWVMIVIMDAVMIWSAFD